MTKLLDKAMEVARRLPPEDRDHIARAIFKDHHRFSTRSVRAAPFDRGRWQMGRLNLIYETHSTSLDNEEDLASGHHDADLSPKGEKQAEELGQRYRGVEIAAVYLPDQLRARRTAAIAFARRGIPLIEDSRLRECDYGEWTRFPVAFIAAARKGRVDEPYPGGESWRQSSARIESFLDDLQRKHKDGETVLVIGNRAVQFGLEHRIKKVPLADAVVAPWKWRPGWKYPVPLS